MRIAYYGSPSVSADVLQYILDHQTHGYTILEVHTRQDKPSGRKRVITPTPVKILAQKYKLQVLTTVIPTAEVDLAIVFSYGRLIPETVLGKPRYGFWNIHPSLLPLYRGPTPVASALRDGQMNTGVSIIQLDAELDHGPILRQEKYAIHPHIRHQNLLKLLSLRGASIVVDMLKHVIQGGSIQFYPQNNALATYTTAFTRDDGHVSYDSIATGYVSERQYRLWQAYDPWPGVWTRLPTGIRMKIIDIAESYKITKIQCEGKNPVAVDNTNQHLYFVSKNHE